MVAVGVVIHLFLRHRVDIDEASGESLPGYGVGVNIDGVFRRHCPPWRHFFWDASCLVFVFQVETFSQFFGGATTAASAPFTS
jgi:hypothetical protein